jgi:hypothetical protein
MLIIVKCRDSCNNFGYVYAFSKRNERLIAVKKFNCSMVLLLIVSGDVNVEPSRKNGYRWKSRDQTDIFLRKCLRFVFAIVKSMTENFVKVKNGGDKKEHEFSFMCIIISMVEPLFYLTQASATGIGIADFFPMLRMIYDRFSKIVRLCYVSIWHPLLFTRRPPAFFFQMRSLSK